MQEGCLIARVLDSREAELERHGTVAEATSVGLYCVKDGQPFGRGDLLTSRAGSSISGFKERLRENSDLSTYREHW